MPFVANTPESRLARSDSKDPKSTCRGITSAGRPCRRPIGAAAAAAAATRPADSDDGLYCWQHKEQAGRGARRTKVGGVGATVIREEEEEGRRGSIDTLADRLGLVDLEGKQGGLSSTSGTMRPTKTTTTAKKKKKKKTNQLEFCFCFRIPIEELEEDDEKPRPCRPKPSQSYTHHHQTMTPTYRPPHPNHPKPPPPPPYTKYHHYQHSSPSSPSPSSPSPSSSFSPSQRPAPIKHAMTPTQMRRLIPASLDATTVSALMAELARPPTDSDEPGYIYIFWLVQDPTSPSSPPPSSTARRAPAPVEAARSLLLPSSPQRGTAAADTSGRRASEIVSRYASQRGSRPDSRPSSMLLKIGRAANVQRRMNQWQRQCGYDVEVLRYYPYASQGTTGSAAMTPHAKRVERLVHMELSGRGMRVDRQTCDACGRGHREWFRVGATREEVRKVDEVIRRWVGWDVGG